MFQPCRLCIALLLFPAYVRCAYPKSLAFTSDVTLACILADIPLFSVGLVAFAAFTFFFVMRRLNRVTIFIHLAAMMMFAAAIFDLSQVVKRGYSDTLKNLDVSSVQLLIVLRDLSHSFSFGLRFVFFWAFVSEPPRGELPFVSMTDNRRPNFISLDSEEIIHSGNWARFRVLGVLVKWLLLAVIIGVVTLQILWRLVTALDDFGPVYFTDAGLQIGLSAVFMLKILYNTAVSPLSPRWKTLRDYSPVFFALGIGAGIEIGNIVCFKFTESTLGRLLQAIEVYTLILFVLISAFYKMPVRSSVVTELVRRRLTAMGMRDAESGTGSGIEKRDSQFSMVQAPYQIPPLDTMLSQGSNKASNRPSFTQRLSSNFNTKFLNRRTQNMGQPMGLADEGDQRRLWDREEAEQGPSSGGQRSYRFSLDQSSPEQATPGYGQMQPSWRDPVMTSVLSNERNLQNIRSTASPVTRSISYPTTRAVGSPVTHPIASPVASPRPLSPPPTNSIVPDDASLYSVGRDTLMPPTSQQMARDTIESPIYGLDGIIRNLQRDGGLGASPEPYNDTSARSSGMESLLRQQQELDRSIQGLRRFSTSSAIRSDPRFALSESIQSDFSLSKFPDPPFVIRSTPSSPLSPTIPEVAGIKDDSALTDAEETSTFRAKSGAPSAISDNSMVVDDVPFQLVPPRMPAAMAESRDRNQSQSIPTIGRDSLDSVFNDAPSRPARLDSQGTQYDVTSFIGRLTAPAPRSPLANIDEKDRSTDSDAGSMIVPATISELTRVQVVDSKRRSLDSVIDSGIGHTPDKETSTIPLVVVAPPPPVAVTALRPEDLPQQRQNLLTQSPPQLLSTRPLFVQPSNGSGAGRSKGVGLPTGPRGRLEISKPIRRDSDSDAVGGRNAFQRPRPAPLKLQTPNDARPVAPERQRDGFYF